MKKKSPFAFLVFILVFTGLSCNTVYQSQSLQYKTYRINDKQQKDSSLLNFLQPYSDNVNQKMNDVVGVAAVRLKPSPSACCASERELWKDCAGVLPCKMGERSRTDKGIFSIEVDCPVIPVPEPSCRFLYLLALIGHGLHRRACFTSDLKME